MKQTVDPSLAFSLIRDDLPFRLQRRAGLIPEQGLGIMRRVVFFIVLTWLPIVIWALLTGRILPGTVDDPLLRHFGVHVRFLLAVPLFIAGEGIAHQTSTMLIPYFLSSGVVPAAQKQNFAGIIGDLTRLRDSPPALACDHRAHRYLDRPGHGIWRI